MQELPGLTYTVGLPPARVDTIPEDLLGVMRALRTARQPRFALIGEALVLEVVSLFLACLLVPTAVDAVLIDLLGVVGALSTAWQCRVALIGEALVLEVVSLFLTFLLVPTAVDAVLIDLLGVVGALRTAWQCRIALVAEAHVHGVSCLARTLLLGAPSFHAIVKDLLSGVGALRTARQRRIALVGEALMLEVSRLTRTLLIGPACCHAIVKDLLSRVSALRVTGEVIPHHARCGLTFRLAALAPDTIDEDLLGQAVVHRRDSARRTSVFARALLRAFVRHRHHGHRTTRERTDSENSFLTHDLHLHCWNKCPNRLRDTASYHAPFKLVKVFHAATH